MHRDGVIHPFAETGISPVCLLEVEFRFSRRRSNSAVLRPGSRWRDRDGPHPADVDALFRSAGSKHRCRIAGGV